MPVVQFTSITPSIWLTSSEKLPSRIPSVRAFLYICQAPGTQAQEQWMQELCEVSGVIATLGPKRSQADSLKA